MSQNGAGAQRIFDALSGSSARGPSRLLRTMIRTWGFWILLFIIFMHLTFDVWGEASQAFSIWLSTYLVYNLLLRFILQAQGFYETRWCQGIRLLTNLILITWLMTISPGARIFLWFFYIMPIFAAVFYFVDPVWTALSIVGSAVGLYFSSITTDAHSLTWGQYFAILSALTLLGAVLHWLLSRVLWGWGILTDVGERLYQTLDLEEVVRTMVDTAFKLSGADRVLLIITDPKGYKYRTHACQGLELKHGKSIEEVAAGCYILQTGKPCLSSDLEAALIDRLDEYFDCRPKSALGLPIVGSGQQLLGILVVAHEAPNRFGRIVQDLIYQFCRRAGDAVANCLTHRRAQLDSLEASQARSRLFQANSEQQVVNSLEREAKAQLPSAASSCVYRRDPETGKLIRWSVSPVAQMDHCKDCEDAGIDIVIASRALESGEPVLVPDIAVSSYLPYDHEVKFASFLSAPMLCPDTGIEMGALGVCGVTKRAFHTADEIALANLAHQGALALARVREFANWRNSGGNLLRMAREVQRFDMDTGDTELCEHIAHAARRLLGFEMARVRLRDPRTDDLVTVAVAGIPHEDAVQIIGHRAPLDDFTPLFSPEFKAERSYLIPCNSAVWAKIPPQHFYNPKVNKRQCNIEENDWGKDSAWLIPLVGQSEEWVGLLTVDVPTTGKLPSRQEIEEAGVYATMVAQVIEEARFRRRLREQQGRTEVFIRSIKQLTRTHDEDALGQVVVQIGADLLCAEACSMYLKRRKVQYPGWEVELTHSTYLAGTSHIHQRKPINSKPKCGLAAWVAATGEPLRFNNGEHQLHSAWSGNTEHLQYLESGECKSLLVVPIKKADDPDILGVINLENKLGEYDFFSEEDESLLEELAHYVASALEAIGHQEKLRTWERAGLEDDFHEFLGRYHSVVLLYLEAIAEWLQRGNLDKARSLVDILLPRARNLAGELRGIHAAIATEEIEDLKEALAMAVNSWVECMKPIVPTLTIPICCPEKVRLPGLVRGTLLRVAHEGLANAMKYSGILEDHNVELSVEAEYEADQEVTLRVRDNGQGSYASNLKVGYGIRRMRRWASRLTEAGFPSKVHTDTAPGRGFEIVFRTSLSTWQ